VVKILVVVVVVVIYFHEKPFEENSKMYEYNEKIYNIIYAIPNLHHANIEANAVVSEYTVFLCSGLLNST